ncbi:MAG: flagellar filament outer layer protein FlaA, partial [Salinispira sp.]
MKKFLAFIFITLIASTSVFAEESKLIDFNTINGANTEIDISTDAQSDQLIVSLNIDDWRVILNSSANSVSNQSVSTIKTSTVNGGMFAGESVLGARIHFPVAPVNAWGLIKPPFEIPAYYGAGGSQFMNNGVVINVGTIKEIRTYVYGLNYPHSISVILEDHT